MKAYIFQHVPFEGPAAIAYWLTQNNFTIEYVRFYESFAIPTLDHVDWLILMGGAMSVNDEHEFPWLAEEKKFIRHCIEAGKKVVGVCLGSQLIANALGSKVFQGKEKEIGWFPIYQSDSIYTSGNSIPKQITVFHWHGETFDLPIGASLIASSKACSNQIFWYSNNVLAMQCHLEMTPEAIAGMLKHCSQEIHPAPYIQTANEIEEGTALYASYANILLFSLLNELKGK